MALGEFDLIAKYFSPPTRRAVLGGGDDCALLQPAPGQQLAISTDLLLEGRHFLPTVAPEAVWVWVPSAALAVIATIRKATRKIFLGNTGMCRIKQSRSAAIPEV